MLLSEAIYLGSKLRPQAFGNYLTLTGSCAVGAAFEALGLKKNLIPAVEQLKQLYDWMRFENTSCPVANCDKSLSKSSKRYRPGHLIIHLNDHHKWTRERIADWVASIEPTSPVESAHEVLAEPLPEPVGTTR